MSLSNYSLNLRLNYILSLLQGLVPPAGGFVTIAGNQTLTTGVKTFTNLPECSAIPTTNNMLVNKLYADSLTSDTLQEVLTAGNDSNLTILLKDTLVTPTLTNTISSSAVSIGGDGGSASIGFSVGDANVNGTATGIISGSVNSATNLSLSNFTVSTPPFFQPANTTATLSTGTTSASLAFTSGGQFINAKTMDLTLDGITHTSSTGGNFTISTTDNLVITSDNITATTINETLFTNTAGGLVNPLLTLINSNATGSVAMEIYKAKPTAGSSGDVLFNQSVYGKDSGNLKQEYTRTTHTIRDATGGGEDGSIEFACFVNGAVATFLQLNGVENEINSLKPIDMVGNNIRSSTGSMTLTTALSTGLGNITAVAKGDVAISSSASGSVSLTSGGGGGAVNLSGLAVNITSNGTAGDKTTLTSATTINLVPTTAILTDSKITTLSDTTGSSVDFGSASVDNRFALDENGLLFNQLFSAPVDKINIIDIKNDATAGDNYINQIQTDNLTGTGVQTQNICNLTTQKIIINDNRTTDSKNITIDNNSNIGENRIELIQNSGAGINQSGIINTAGTQFLSLSHTDISSFAKAVSLRQDTSGTGKLQYDNTIDTSAFEISSNNTNLTLQTSSIISGQGDIIIAPSQNGSANGQLVFTGASLQSNTSGGNSGEHLVIVLNGTTYKIKLEFP